MAGNKKLTKAQIAFLKRCKLFGVHLRDEHGSTVRMANALLEEGFLTLGNGAVLYLSEKARAALPGEKDTK